MNDDMNVYIRVKEIFTNPVSFFAELRQEKGVNTAFVYYLALTLVGTVLALTVGSFLQDHYIDLAAKIFGVDIPKPDLTQLTAGTMFTLAVIGIIYSAIVSFVLAGILHAWLLIFGGREKYSKTYQLYVYAQTPQLILSWIPYVGSLAQIYSLILLIIGTQQIHKFSRRKTVLIYLIPVVLLALIALALLGLIMTIARS